MIIIFLKVVAFCSSVSYLDICLNSYRHINAEVTKEESGVGRVAATPHHFYDVSRP